MKKATKETSPQSLTLSLKDFEELLKDRNRVEALGFSYQNLEKLLDQQKTKRFKSKQTITLDLERKFVYITTVENEKYERSEKIRASGHFFDNKLKYSDPNKRQLSLFDISPATREKIESVDFEVKAEGINLTPPQNRLMTALNQLLHEKSEHWDLNSDDYYAGNHESLLVANYGGTGEQRKAPVIKIKPAELYKSYLDAEKYSGADIKYIKSLLHEMGNQKFLICYDRKRQIRKNGKLERRTDRIELFEPLIKIVNYIPDLTDEEVEQLDKQKREAAEKKGSYIIALNPILIDQITTKYVEYPVDIEKRTINAAGGHRKVTAAMLAFRDYMLRELSTKRTKCEIDEEKLIYVIKLGNFIKRREYKRAKAKMSDAIQVSQKLGLVTSVNVVTGKRGQPKFQFELNPYFE